MVDKKLVETTCIKCKKTITSYSGFLICNECNREFESKRKDKSDE